MPSSKTPRSGGKSSGHRRAGGKAAEPYPTSPDVRISVRLQNKASPRHVSMDQTHDFSEYEGGPRRESSGAETNAYDASDSTGGAATKEKAAAARREYEFRDTQKQEVRADEEDSWCRIREQHGDGVSEFMLTNSNSVHAQDAGLEQPMFGAASVSAFVAHSKWNRCDAGGEDEPGDLTAAQIDAAIDEVLSHDTMNLPTIQWDQYLSADVLRAPLAPQMYENHNVIHNNNPTINYALLPLPPVNLSEEAISKQVAAGGAPIDAIVAANPEMKHHLREECHTALNTYSMPYAGMQYPAFTPVPAAVDATALNTYSAPFTSMQHPAFAPVTPSVDATISNTYSTPHAGMWYPPLTPMPMMDEYTAEMFVAHVLANTAQIRPLTVPGDEIFAPTPAVEGYTTEMFVADVLAKTAQTTPLPVVYESTFPGDDSTTEELAVDYAPVTPVNGDVDNAPAFSAKGEGDNDEDDGSVYDDNGDEDEDYVAPKQARKASTSDPTTRSRRLQDMQLEAPRTPQGGHGTEAHFEHDENYVYKALPKRRNRGKKAKLISYTEGQLRGHYPPILEEILIAGQIQCAIPGCGMSFDSSEWTLLEICEHIRNFHRHLITSPPDGQKTVSCPCLSLGCLKTFKFISPKNSKSPEADVAKVIGRHLLVKHLKHRGYSCPLCKSQNHGKIYFRRDVAQRHISEVCCPIPLNGK